MKILMLTPYLPYPLFSGGQTRSYNLLKNLAKNHEITLFSLIKNKEEERYVMELQKFCKKVVVFKRSTTPWTVRNVLFTGFSLYPFLVVRNFSREEKNAVALELEREQYDLIHAETFYVMPHIPKTEIPVLLVEQTIEYLVYKHYVEEQAPFWLRLLLWIDLAKIRFWETYFWKKANRVVAMSESDRNSMRELVPGLHVDIVPNGIDPDYFQLREKKKKGPLKILYVGNFKWLQNTEAAQLLVDHIWPEIKKRVTNTRLWIVGMGINPEIRRLAREDVEISEGIPDIREAYQKSDVLVAPIQGPGGTRLKILEAMASGVPVVTTKVGVEGLEIKDGKHALVRDSDSEIVDAVIKVLTDAELAASLAQQARKLVIFKYTWRTCAQILDSIYREVAKKDGEN